MAFHYNELLAHDETIRLLQIAPSTNLDSSVPLECSILKTRLELAPVYSALSYTWGNDAATVSLSINGLSFMIRPNLHSALLALRYVSLKRILWVDAVCINQNDAIEKEYQVGLMRKIYQRASSVTIWLSTYDEEIGEAFTFIRQLQGSNAVADVSGGAFEQKIAQRPWETGDTLPNQSDNSRELHVRHTYILDHSHQNLYPGLVVENLDNTGGSCLAACYYSLWPCLAALDGSSTFFGSLPNSKHATRCA